MGVRRLRRSGERRVGEEWRSRGVTGVQTCALPIYFATSPSASTAKSCSRSPTCMRPGRARTNGSTAATEIGRAACRGRVEISGGDWSSDVCSSDLLRDVAERLDCEVVLALADVHETWSCEDEWEYGGY